MIDLGSAYFLRRKGARNSHETKKHRFDDYLTSHKQWDDCFLMWAVCLKVLLEALQRGGGCKKEDASRFWPCEPKCWSARDLRRIWVNSSQNSHNFTKSEKCFPLIDKKKKKKVFRKYSSQQRLLCSTKQHTDNTNLNLEQLPMPV